MPSVDASVESLQIDPMKRVWLLASVGAAVGVVATGVVAAAFAVDEIAVNFECPLEQVVSIRAAEFE